MPYLSASVVVIHYEEALYQVYVPTPLPLLHSTIGFDSKLSVNRFQRCGVDDISSVDPVAGCGQVGRPSRLQYLLHMYLGQWGGLTRRRLYSRAPR